MKKEKVSSFIDWTPEQIKDIKELLAKIEEEDQT